MSVFKDVQPKNVFHYFEEISKIPRGSYRTKEISDYLVRFAKAHGLFCAQDGSDNVLIVKDASAGYEDAPPVILQGHMDMVCVKEEGCAVDFETEGVKLFVDGDFVKARGTTLGADDGIAVAYALSILEDSSLAHPRLEVVITSDEEVGMLGAKSMDLSLLKGHILLNIDSDVEGHFLVGCAGGVTARATFPVAWRKMEGTCVSLRVHGLLGGHSGSEIDKGRANAILLLGRLLRGIAQTVQLGIASLAGGQKDNAIPREASAVIVIPQGTEGALREILLGWEKTLRDEYAPLEPSLAVSMEPREACGQDVLTGEAAGAILRYLNLVPNGVMHWSAKMKGLVEASLNAGILTMDQESCSVTSSIRSNVLSRKEEIAGKVGDLAAALGGSLSFAGDYPAWEYRADSPIRKKAAEVYERMFGKGPEFEAIHAGLECGIFAEKIKGMDAVSFGPNNFDIHTPKERLSISSTERVYRFLLELLRSMG